MRAPSPFSAHPPFVLITLLLACAVPPLVAYNLTPSATLFNQLAALGSWGLVLVAVAMATATGTQLPSLLQLRGGAAV